MNKPTKEQIEQWVSALRSGKYKQTKTNLQDDNGYCCLGVACDLFIPQYKLDVVDSTLFLKGYYPSDQENAPDWLKTMNRNFRDITGSELHTLNDFGTLLSGTNSLVEPLTFDEIADLLEAVYILEVLN